MRIAISGAHRVGKTTLAEKLQEALKQYDYQPEPYYALEERGYRFSETPGIDDFLAQLEYSPAQVSAGTPDVIFDRCPADLLAYIQAMNGTHAVRGLYDQVESAMDTIDLLVFVPVEYPDPIGCPEPELPDLRAEVNEILHDWLPGFDTDTIQVTGTIAQREKLVMVKVRQLRSGI